eukprot:TRINITY_DN4952_c0_g1_i1.p1 TRINITY_DN4952_c0_g1~~TRINITY_DN4952_c0_g1_i1.p1  ORF type:complete len:355 (+),score=117.14 TRINITY_DN4952_c0_g1_i1:187-1251(+)
MAISSGFMFALLTKRVLTVEDSGFYASMNDLFDPPGFDWLRRTSRLDAGATISNPHAPPWLHTDPLLCQNLSKAYKSKGVSFAVNQYLVPYMAWNPHYRGSLEALFKREAGGWGEDELVDLFQPVARFLFRPVAELRRMRDEFVEKQFSGRPVVSLQVRSGADFTSHFMTKADWRLYAECGRESLSRDGRTLYFVATDTEKGRDAAKAHLGADNVVFGPGPFLRSNNPRGVRMALLDVMLLAEADVLVTTAWSSFGYMAAGLHGRRSFRVTDVVPGGETAVPLSQEQFYMGVPHKSDRRVACRQVSYQPCFHKFANWGARRASCYTPDMVDKEMLNGRFCAAARAHAGAAAARC